MGFIVIGLITSTEKIEKANTLEKINEYDDITRNLKLRKSGPEDNGCEYLIITHEDFSETIEVLANDKISHGISTKIVNLSSICEDPTPENISNFIQSAYENWIPQPKYVLLVGDVEYIPAHTCVDYPYSTDLYYATVNGSDYFPDLYVGRFPVKNNEELEIIINKTINYEENYDPEKEIFSNVLLAAYNQSDGEDRYYITTSESIREFLENNSYSTTTVYSGPGQDGTTEDIINCVNEGALLLNHRDHGTVSGWYQPSFTIYDINYLNNNHFQPAMFSINCQSGKFDYSSDCFGEAILKAKNKGISAFIGASTASYSGYNDELNKGLFASIFPEYYPHYSNGNVTRSAELGGILNFGKMFMYDKYYLTNGEGYRWNASEEITHLQFEIMNLLGDPELSIIDNKAPEIYNLSLKSDTLYEGETQKLSFNVRDKFALDSMNITIDNNSQLLTNLTENFYEFSFIPNKIGNHVYKIEINDTSGNVINLTGDFLVKAEPLILEIPPMPLESIANEHFLCDINITSPLSGPVLGNVSISTDWTRDYNFFNHNNGTYTFNFSTANLPESGTAETYSIKVSANKSGYSSTSDFIKTIVYPIQSIISVNESTVKILIDENFNLKVNFIENISGNFIFNANCSVDWICNSDIIRIFDGFIISFSTKGLKKGNYSATIFMNKPTYETSFKTINIIIEEPPSTFNFDLVIIGIILISVAGISIAIIKKTYH